MNNFSQIKIISDKHLIFIFTFATVDWYVIVSIIIIIHGNFSPLHTLSCNKIAFQKSLPSHNVRSIINIVVCLINYYGVSSQFICWRSSFPRGIEPITARGVKPELIMAKSTDVSVENKTVDRPRIYTFLRQV